MTAKWSDDCIHKHGNRNEDQNKKVDEITQVEDYYNILWKIAAELKENKVECVADATVIWGHNLYA